MFKISTITRQIDTLLQKAIMEAEEDGVEITSPQFQEALEKLKIKLAEAHNISLEDYEKTKKVSGVFEKLEKAVEGFSDQIKKIQEKTDWKIREIDSKVGLETNELRNLLTKLQDVLSTKDRELKDKVDKKEITKIDEKIDKISAEADIKKSEIDKRLKKKEKELDKIVNKRIEKVKETKFEKEFSDEEKQKLKELMGRDWFNVIQEEIHDLTPRLWQGMAGGLKKMINKNSIENFVYNEVLSGTVDGSNKTFTLSKTPKSGSLILKDENGVVIDEDAGDYSISDTTVTLSYAPISKAPKALLYRK